MIPPMKEKETPIVTGVIRVHPRGFGFLPTEEYPQDVFVPKPHINGAVDGDTVDVEINTEAVSEKGPEGRVLAVVRRGRSHVAGTVVELAKKGAAYAYVPLLGDDLMKIRPSEERKFQIGDRLVIHVVEWGSARKESAGEMQSYIGHISDPSLDTIAAVEEYELSDAFSRAVVKEAKVFGEEVSEKDKKGREDLRQLETFTIDPETAKDFDDALSLTQDKKGNYHLAIHIADVSHYVRPGSRLDSEARARCNSVYFPGSVLPMLPFELSNNLCSLKPKVDRLTVSVLVDLDEKGTVLNYRIVKSVIKSAKRFSYGEAKLVLDGEKKSKHAKTLKLMVELCHRLKEKRYERGSIEFSLPAIQLHVNKKGDPEKVEFVEYDITHQLVEEFMLMANETIATHLAKEEKPLTYRVHAEPTSVNMKEFATLANAYGFNLPEAPSTRELQELFDEARESPVGQFLATSFIKSMRLASYSTQNIGHYGLGLDYYTHFTSPIRRYIDLVVHRALFGESSPNEDFEEIALQCSERERLSAKAENSVILLKKLRLLHQSQKDDPYRKYDAIITQVKPVGCAFEVEELMIEGFFPVSRLSEDYFVYEDLRLVGRHTEQSYRCGDRIKVAVEVLDFITKTAFWTLVPSGRKKRRRR
ncbi:MAG: Ribonuclease R [Chlamydiae bacterium]|nr:Ribonuclease R [Chlamydiota bacterium]